MTPCYHKDIIVTIILTIILDSYATSIFWIFKNIMPNLMKIQ